MMIRRWFKKLIAEAITENFPAFEIKIEEIDKTRKRVNLKNCIFNNSQIQIGSLEPAEVEMNHCIAKINEKPLLHIKEEPPGE